MLVGRKSGILQGDVARWGRGVEDGKSGNVYLRSGEDGSAQGLEAREMMGMGGLQVY